MAKRFDAALKHLLETYSNDWLRFLGVEPTGRVQVLDADLSTVTSDADKVYRIQNAAPWLLHLEMQASADRKLAKRVLKYNVLLDDRHDLPVQSVVVLLRPEADRPPVTGSFHRGLPNGRGYHDFSFDVVRLWQQPVESVIGGGLGILPLAPICAVDKKTVPGVIRQMKRRLNQEADSSEAATLRTATFVLMGLRYPDPFTYQLLKGFGSMKESTTYQAIIREGKTEGTLEEAIRMVLRLGSKKLGPLSARTRTAIERIGDAEKLEELAERVLSATTWDELLAGQTLRRNGGRKK